MLKNQPVPKTLKTNSKAPIRTNKSKRLSTSHKQPHTLRKQRTTPQTQHNVLKRQTSSFSTVADNNSSQSLPKIPKLSYLKYDHSTDILAVLKSRGFMNQTTPGIDKHFNSELDLSPESITSCLNALTSRMMIPEAGSDGDARAIVEPDLIGKMPVYKSKKVKSDETTTTNDDDDNEDISTYRPTNRFSRRAVYAGFDPTASSLHLGNLLVILSLMHFSRAGHQVVALTGGATGMVGDPSGRSTERVLQSAEQVKHNVSEINGSLLRLLQLPPTPVKLKKKLENTENENDNISVPPIFVDNFDWYHNMSVIDFLRDIGKNFRVSSMLAKDSVKSRMSTEHGSGDGISFTEFSYQVLQGYDFNHLNQKYGVSLQIGGSDQWGNITAGIDCIHRAKSQRAAQEKEIEKDGKKESKKDKKSSKQEETNASDLIDDSVHGITLPLLTTAQGVKFGKSMGNAIWINPNMTSSYQLYQYLLSSSDLDCKKFLNVFTFLTQDSINNIMTEHAKLPDARIPQRILGCEVVRLLHGDIGVKQALAATKLLFKDKFAVDMGHYTSEFNSIDEFEAFESAQTRVLGKNEQEKGGDDVGVGGNVGKHELVDGLDIDQYTSALQGVPITHLPSLATIENKDLLNKPDTHPYSILNIAVATKLCTSKSEARRLIKNNGLSIFSEKITSEDFVLTPEYCSKVNAPFGKLVMLKSGQKKIHMAVLPDQ